MKSIIIISLSLIILYNPIILPLIRSIKKIIINNDLNRSFISALSLRFPKFYEERKLNNIEFRNILKSEKTVIYLVKECPICNGAHEYIIGPGSTFLGTNPTRIFLCPVKNELYQGIVRLNNF